MKILIIFLTSFGWLSNVVKWKEKTQTFFSKRKANQQLNSSKNSNSKEVIKRTEKSLSEK